MNEDDTKLLAEIDAFLDSLLAGGKNAGLELSGASSPFYGIIEKLNLLKAYLAEMSSFAADISNGRLYGDTPDRHNHFCGPLKQLRANLSSLSYDIGELLKGNMAAKIEVDEENVLYKCYNSLVDHFAGISGVSGLQAESAANGSGSLNSWQYHSLITAINKIDTIFMLVDVDGGIVYANKLAVKFLNGRTNLHDGQGADGNDAVLHAIEQNSRSSVFPITREIFDKNSGLWYKITTYSFNLANVQNYFLHILDDISDFKKTEEYLIAKADIDLLTGTFTRRAGLSILNKLSAEGGGPHCLTMLDIDGLKYVNDTYGHMEGDEYIKIVAEILKTSVRATEAVIRYGGDEFLVLFKNCAPELAEKIMSRMQGRLGEMNSKKMKPYTLSFSYGTRPFGKDSPIGLGELISTVDEDMYNDKKNKPGACRTT